MVVNENSFNSSAVSFYPNVTKFHMDIFHNMVNIVLKFENRISSSYFVIQLLFSFSQHVEVRRDEKFY